MFWYEECRLFQGDIRLEWLTWLVQVYLLRRSVWRWIQVLSALDVLRKVRFLWFYLEIHLNFFHSLSFLTLEFALSASKTNQVLLFIPWGFRWSLSIFFRDLLNLLLVFPSVFVSSCTTKVLLLFQFYKSALWGKLFMNAEHLCLIRVSELDVLSQLIVYLFIHFLWRWFI